MVKLDCLTCAVYRLCLSTCDQCGLINGTGKGASEECRQVECRPRCSYSIVSILPHSFRSHTHGPASFLFNCLFSFTYTPLQGVIPAEALETTMRAKGLAMSGIIVSAIGFINQFAGPIGLGNIGYHYIWIFVRHPLSSFLQLETDSISGWLGCHREYPLVHLLVSATPVSDS